MPNFHEDLGKLDTQISKLKNALSEIAEIRTQIQTISTKKRDSSIAGTTRYTSTLKNLSSEIQTIKDTEIELKKSIRKTGDQMISMYPEKKPVIDSYLTDLSLDESPALQTEPQPKPPQYLDITFKVVKNKLTELCKNLDTKPKNEEPAQKLSRLDDLKHYEAVLKEYQSISSAEKKNKYQLTILQNIERGIESLQEVAYREFEKKSSKAKPRDRAIGYEQLKKIKSPLRVYEAVAAALTPPDFDKIIDETLKKCNPLAPEKPPTHIQAHLALLALAQDAAWKKQPDRSKYYSAVATEYSKLYDQPSSRKASSQAVLERAKAKAKETIREQSPSSSSKASSTKR